MISFLSESDFLAVIWPSLSNQFGSHYTIRAQIAPKDIPDRIASNLSGSKCLLRMERSPPQTAFREARERKLKETRRLERTVSEVLIE